VKRVKAANETFFVGTVCQGGSVGSVIHRATADCPGRVLLDYDPAWAEDWEMRCIEFDAAEVSERLEHTAREYQRFRRHACDRQFNERSGGILNRAQYPSDVIALVVFWRLRYKLSLRDLPEMFLIRGIEFSYEAVRDWEAKLTPSLIDSLRKRRKGRIGKSWYVDETYIKVNGRWCYLYRAIDRFGALVDVRLSEARDMKAAKAFFRSAKAVTGVVPARVTTDGHDSYPRAIRTELNKDAKHRTGRYLNNRIEQDHRGIKGRYRPMRGFKSHASASRFCRCFDELRSHLQIRSRRSRHLPTNARRHRFLTRGIIALRIMEAE
jgi:putative transposase